MSAVRNLFPETVDESDGDSSEASNPMEEYDRNGGSIIEPPYLQS
jgi:hypothetical protein